MPSRYSDSSEASDGPGNSYTDRFRTDRGYAEQAVVRTNGPPSIGHLDALIQRACRPTRREPDLGLNLQVADIVNDKKGGAPRAAAQAILKVINGQNVHSSILAMSVLDVCVKNCGYPFHLQISRKDFLNGLVKRFPEKPPLHYSRVQMLILEAIEEWRETLCRTSKYRDDLGFIRDMHRLLSYKGYMFPEVNRDDAAVLNAPETLKSAAELEKEDREAQSAKLQELLQSSNPEDLREANHLMSVMAGFRETKTDYVAKVAKELDKLRRKGEILEEMLNNLTPGQPIDNDDVFSELVTSLRNARPKIEHMVNEEQEENDEEGLARLIALGDYINQLIEKYELVSKGDFEGAKNVTVASLASGRKIDTSRQAVIDSLIDIDDVPQGSGDTAGDLLGLSFGGLSLGGGSAAAEPESSAPKAPLDDLLSFGDEPAASPSKPASQPSSQGVSQPPPALASPSPAPASPAPAPASASGDLLGEWGFASAPPAAAPATTTVHDQQLKIEFETTKTSDSVSIVTYFSSLSDKKITQLKFEVAAPRSLQLRLEPQSGTTLDAHQSRAITQRLTVTGSSSPKLRWRAVFKEGLSDVTLEGTVSSL